MAHSTTLIPQQPGGVNESIVLRGNEPTLSHFEMEQGGCHMMIEEGGFGFRSSR
jgi:hypothetical protein